MADMTDDERGQLLETIGRSVAQRHDWQNLREDWKGTSDGAAQRRSDLIDLGLYGLLVPEEFGGLNVADVDAIAALEAIAYHNLPGPIMDTMWVMAPVLAKLPANEWRDERLAELAAGELHVVGPQGHTLVSDLGEASYFATIADSKLRSGRVADLSYEQVHAMDPGRSLYRLDPGVDPTTVAEISDSPEIVAEFQRRIRIGHATLLNGLSRRILDKTVEYVKGREQFGRPVGSFQAIKHILADATAQLYLAQNSAWAAARRLQADPAAANISALAAQISSIEAHELANDAGLQCHGGIGFTWEYDLHELLKRGKSLQYYYAQKSTLVSAVAAEIESEGFVWD